MRPCPLAVLLLAACSSPPSRAARASRPAPDAGSAPHAAFLPADYQGELFIDWDRMREIELLYRVLRLPAVTPYFEALARERGSDLDHQARTRTAFVTVDHRQRSVSVVELAPDAPRPPAPKHWSPVRIGGHEGFSYRNRSEQCALVWPAPDLAVSGTLELLEDLVAGRHPTGGPHPELAPMLSGDGVLVQLVYGRFGHPWDDLPSALQGWFGDRDDPVDFLRVRLHEDRRGDLAVSVTLRFQNGTSGLRGAQAHALARFDEVRKDTRLAAFREFVDAVVVARAERDLTLRLKLGTPRQAVATAERAVFALVAMMQARSGKGR